MAKLHDKSDRTSEKPFYTIIAGLTGFEIDFATDGIRHFQRQTGGDKNESDSPW